MYSTIIVGSSQNQGARPVNSPEAMSEPEDNIHELQDNPETAALDHVDRVRAQWAAERPELDTAPVAVIARLGRAAAYVDAGINAGLAQFGLTREAWDVLASLRRTGPPYRLSPTRLYLGLMRSSGAMTHRLAGLERAGLVTRVQDPEDGRSLLVQLTRKGLSIVERVAPVHLATERDLLADLTDEEQRLLADLLRKLLHGYERQSLAPPPSGRGGRHKARRRR
jgi:DNA-binding MarR family transcriptional regulator